MIAIIDYCQFEDVPKEQSETYRSIKEFHGEEIADQFTYEVEVKLPESTGMDRTILYNQE